MSYSQLRLTRCPIPLSGTRDRIPEGHSKNKIYNIILKRIVLNGPTTVISKAWTCLKSPALISLLKAVKSFFKVHQMPSDGGLETGS